MRSLFYWIVLCMVLISAFAVTQLQLTDVFHDVDALVLLLLIFLVVRKLFFKSGMIKTASGAIVMSAGIFLSGAFHHFTAVNESFGKLAALALFLFWLLMMVAYAKSFFSKERTHHFSHPINSFAVGTWVAGTSVCGAVVYHQLPELKVIYVGMAVLDGVLWILFFVLCLNNFKKVFSGHLYHSIHGVVLLSTVSTQSLVVFYSTLFGEAVPRMFTGTFIMLGAIFYGLGFILILMRYFPFRDLDMGKHWYNTNCILHGAMSITGLAGVLSGSVPQNIVTAIWVWSLAWFVVVELCEVYRAVVRVRTLGLSRGIGTYDVSQWARNFTFGMFFTFSMNISLPLGSFLGTVRAFILTYGAWVILLLFVNEVLLFFKTNGQWARFKRHRQLESHHRSLSGR